MASPTGTMERRLVRLSGTAALAIVGTIVGLVVAGRTFVAAHQPLSWAAAAVVAAVLLDPVVDRLAVHIRRVPAVLLTFLAVGAVGVGTTYLVFDDVERALDDRVTGGGDVLRSTAGTAPTYLVCTILTVFLMTYGPRMAKAALEQDPDEARRARIADVVGPAVSRARSAVIFAVAESLLVALAVAGVAGALDLPAPSAVGFSAGVLSLFPHVGLTIGTIPLLLLALGFRSLPTALVLLVVVLSLQVVDSLVVRPRLAARSVEIGLVVPWVVALVGYAVYGVGGAAYATAYAIFGLAILDRLDQANPDRT